MRQLERIKSLLFVCFANTCRSPMAEGLAKKILGNKMRIESAGLIAVIKSAAKEAVEVLQNLYGIDISNHYPRSVSDLNLNRFDLIIGIDPIVSSNLHIGYPHLSEKILLWEIEDPYGKDSNAYKETAEKIQGHIKRYLAKERIQNIGI